MAALDILRLLPTNLTSHELADQLVRYFEKEWPPLRAFEKADRVVAPRWERSPMLPFCPGFSGEQACMLNRCRCRLAPGDDVVPTEVMPATTDDRLAVLSEEGWGDQFSLVPPMPVSPFEALFPELAYFDDPFALAISQTPSPQPPTPPPPATPSTHAKDPSAPRSDSWSPNERQLCADLLHDIKTNEPQRGVDGDEGLWATISTRMAAAGFPGRTRNGVKMFWSRIGRAEFGYDERSKKRSAALQTSLCPKRGDGGATATATATGKKKKKEKRQRQASVDHGGDESEAAEPRSRAPVLPPHIPTAQSDSREVVDLTESDEVAAPQQQQQPSKKRKVSSTDTTSPYDSLVDESETYGEAAGGVEAVKESDEEMARRLQSEMDFGLRGTKRRRQ